MRRTQRSTHLLRGIAIILLLLLAKGLTPLQFAHADAAPFYGFEDGTDGFTAPSWLASNAGLPTQSSAQYSQGAFSLALPVNYINGGWDQAGTDVVINNYNSVDLTGYAAVSYDVYVPVPNIISQVVFNDPWLQPSNPKPLQVGWNTLTFDISPTSQDFPNAGSYFSTAKEFLLLAIGRGVTYNGPIYFDNVHFIPSTHPLVQMAAPLMDATLSVPQGQTYTINAAVRAPAGTQISSVTFSTSTQSGTLSYDSANNVYTGSWDIWKEGEGLKTLSITATASDGTTTTQATSVLIQDSQLQVHITSPTFDQQVQGNATITAQITPDPRFALQSVNLVVGKLQIPMVAAAAGSYTAQLKTTALTDGVQTLRVVARDSQFSVSDLADILVQNHVQSQNIIKASGTTFSDGGKPFSYVGTNEILFPTANQTVAHDEQTIEGNIILAGTQLTWQQQIDRQMLEVERRGLSVMRTWAFDDSSADDANAFQTAPGVYNEAQFAKMDYIVASAQRHHIRLIISLSNYWSDYGGIQQYAKWLGLPNKLLFFTDAQAQSYYKQYVAHLVNRVNTVNGVAYKNDPTIFSWELMNEPRMDCNDDPTPTHQYCDPSGKTLQTWISDASSYIKSLDPAHMVSTGSEGHGLIPKGPDGKGIQWGGSQEGTGDDPLLVQNVPTIDFFTFHPYLNASWINLTLPQAKQLITGITAEGLQDNKPVVMEEYGLDRGQPLYNSAGILLQPADPAYAATRITWYQSLLKDFYLAGGVGSNVWTADAWNTDTSYSVNDYLPLAAAQRDAPLLNILQNANIAPTTLRAVYLNGNTDPVANQQYPHLEIINQSNTPIDLSQVSVRYWYTLSDSTNPHVSQTSWCDYAAVKCKNITTSFGALSSPVSGADHYLTLGFTTGAGRLQPGANTGKIELRLAKNDWSNFNGTGDYSWTNLTNYTAWPYVTVYYQGKLVWGNEPT